MVNQMPTFKNEIETGILDNYYLPDNIYVVSTVNTFSSGYTLMYYLYTAGAKLIGTPSSQSGNCFGDILSFKLKHSKLTGGVSHKKFIYFPDDKNKGEVLNPHYLLKYDKLVAYNFDFNAEILLAIEIAKNGK